MCNYGLEVWIAQTYITNSINLQGEGGFFYFNSNCMKYECQTSHRKAFQIPLKAVRLEKNVHVETLHHEELQGNYA